MCYYFYKKMWQDWRIVIFEDVTNLTFVLKNEPNGCVLIDMFDLPHSTTGVNQFTFKNDVIDAKY